MKGATLQPKRFQRRKFCRFCSEKVEYIDYKNIKVLRSFLTERGKILPRRMTGNCAKHQRELTESINRARNIALLAFAEK
jgi:small subunit ribosomal protein S18